MLQPFENYLYIVKCDVAEIYRFFAILVAISSANIYIMIVSSSDDLSLPYYGKLYRNPVKLDREHYGNA